LHLYFGHAERSER